MQPSLSQNPTRTPVEEAVRTDDIARAIGQVSDVSDKESCQYKSMQWVINDDKVDPPLFYDEPQVFQRFALKTLFCLLDGSSWKDDTNWSTNYTECDWYGISCDEKGNIKNVDLNANELSGNFPSEFGLLTSVGKLSISQFYVVGNIC